MFTECPLVDYMRGTEPPSSSVEWPQAVLSVFSCYCTQKQWKPDPGKGRVHPRSNRAHQQQDKGQNALRASSVGAVALLTMRRFLCLHLEGCPPAVKELALPHIQSRWCSVPRGFFQLAELRVVGFKLGDGSEGGRD